MNVGLLTRVLEIMVTYTLLFIFYYHLIFLMDSKVNTENESKGCSQTTLTTF